MTAIRKELTEFHDTIAPQFPGRNIQVGALVEAFNQSRRQSVLGDIQSRLLSAQDRMGRGTFELLIAADTLSIFYWSNSRDAKAVAHSQPLDLNTALDLIDAYAAEHHQIDFEI